MADGPVDAPTAAPDTAGIGRGVGDRIARQEQPAGVIDDDDRPVGPCLDAADDVEGVVRLDQGEAVERRGPKDHPAGRGPVVEREAIGAQVDDQPADADVPTDERGEVAEVRVFGIDRWCGGRARALAGTPGSAVGARTAGIAAAGLAGDGHVLRATWA